MRNLTIMGVLGVVVGGSLATVFWSSVVSRLSMLCGQ